MWTNPNLFSKEPSARPKKQCKPISLKSCESSIMDLLDATVTTVTDPTLHSSEVLHADDCLPDLHVDLKERIQKVNFHLFKTLLLSYKILTRINGQISLMTNATQKFSKTARI